MSTPRIPAPLQSSASPKDEARPILRVKTIATRVDLPPENRTLLTTK